MTRTAKDMSDAIRAYKTGESALSIQSRTGIPNQTLYHHMRSRGVKTNQARRKDRKCRCGNSLIGRELRAKYCSRTCSAKYRLEDMRQALLAAGEMKFCLHCNDELFGKRWNKNGLQGRMYCNAACRLAFQERLRAERVAAVAKYAASNIKISVIANRIEIGCVTARKYRRLADAA